MATNSHYDDALHWAASNGYLEVCKLLLENGADVHAWNDHSFRRAAENGHSEVCRLLLEHGADIHAEDDGALRWAALNGHFEICKFLLENGADLTVFKTLSFNLKKIVHEFATKEQIKQAKKVLSVQKVMGT
jgi:ankyrin repeat protein